MHVWCCYWPSHLVGHDDSVEHTSHAQASPQSPPPTRLSPPLFSGSAHDGGCIFAPTPGQPTPPIVQAEPIQDPSLPNPEKLATQIEQIRSENIELVHGLWRSLRTDIHPPGYGTGDGKYHDLWKHLWNPQTKHNYKRYIKLVKEFFLCLPPLLYVLVFYLKNDKVIIFVPW